MQVAVCVADSTDHRSSKWRYDFAGNVCVSDRETFSLFVYNSFCIESSPCFKNTLLRQLLSELYTYENCIEHWWSLKFSFSLSLVAFYRRWSRGQPFHMGGGRTLQDSGIEQNKVSRGRYLATWITGSGIDYRYMKVPEMCLYEGQCPSIRNDSMITISLDKCSMEAAVCRAWTSPTPVITCL